VEHDFKHNLGVRTAMLTGPVGASGQPERAAQLLGASESSFQDLGISLQPADKIEIDRYLDDVRAQLDERTFEKAWAEGRTTSLENAVALALDKNAA
jgi:hypothetical protein